MKIAFLVRSLAAGGAERAATSLADAFVHAGHAVTICCLTGTDSFYPTNADVMIRYLTNEIGSSKKTARALVLLRRAKALQRMIRDEKPDVVVGMSWSMALYGIYCTKGISAVCVGSERANPYILNANRLTTFLRRFAARHSDGFVCQTERARSFFPLSAQKKIAVIPNGIFNPLVYDTSVPNDRIRVITALGRLDRNKGFDVLLNAFSRIHGRYPDYRLCIFGEGGLRAELTEQAEKLQLSDCVDLVGEDPHAIAKIAESSVFVLSSRSEGMPNALIEAMAAGVPCVATRCDMGPEELIEDDVNGLLVPVGDADAMADACMRILADPSLSASLSRSALRIRDTHDSARIADLWLQYFESLL